MKTAKEIAIEIEKGIFVDKNMGTEQIEQLLYQWAYSIIDKAMEEVEIEEYNCAFMGTITQVNMYSIEKIKKKL